MNDPLIARFASACGATAPLDLRVDLVGGSVLAEGSIDQPFTLVGRDDACDVTLSDPEINPRHAWLQVLGGRVFVVDLGSRTGLLWPSGWRGPGWLDPGTPVGIGPFQLRLRIPSSDRPSAYPAGYNPLGADAGDKTRPAVALEFRNGRRAKDRWQVNRLLTLVGRAADCKIHLTAEDISPYHCGIVSTPSGLWVVDLSGRGVVVNGERMRVAPLPQGSELWVGRFLIGCQYQTPAPSGKGTGLVVSRPTPTPVAPGDARLTTTPPPLAPEDEVELGAAPDAGLPGSHIMADAFRTWTAPINEPSSNPIHVSGSSSKSPDTDSPTDSIIDGASDPDGNDDRSVVPLLRQLAEIHDHTGDEFQQSMFLLARAFGRVKREHLTVLQHELSRILELTAEINGLQVEAAQHVLTAAADRARHSAEAAESDPNADDPHGARVAPSARTPLPDGPYTTSPAAARAADRLATLQQDRSARWQALVAIFAGP